MKDALATTTERRKPRHIHLSANFFLPSIAKQREIKIGCLLRTSANWGNIFMLRARMTTRTRAKKEKFICYPIT